MKRSSLLFLLVFFPTVIFVFAAFLVGQSYGAQSFFSAYLASEINFLSANLFLFFLYVLVTAFFFTRAIHFNSASFFKKCLFAITNVFAGIGIGFCLAGVILLIIAGIQLNSVALLLNSSPNILGIIDDKASIVTALKNNNQPPEIIATNAEKMKELVAIATATTGKDNLYGRYVLQTIPSSFVLPIHTLRSSILLLDNTLIVTEIDPSDMEAISPTVGYLFVQQYFPTRKIKALPKISIMNRQEYLAYRQEDAKQKIASIDMKLATIAAAVSSTSASMEQDKNQALQNQAINQQAAAQGNAEYKKCMSTGKYTQSDCQKVIAQWKNTVDSGNTTIKTAVQDFTNKKNQLAEYQYYETFLKRQKDLLSHQQEQLPHELGVFEPGDSIKIALDTSNPHTVADYFETVTHEYLHYASYVSPEKRLRDAFFEEGLTEYFAREMIKNDLHTSTNLGYPVFVKIIQQMTHIIPESELADIYFSKDQDALEAALDRVYGYEFYKNNLYLFEALQYSSDPKHVLQLANAIMERIGGKKLTEKDLISTYSSL